jgi:hypothetical protein
MTAKKNAMQDNPFYQFITTVISTRSRAFQDQRWIYTRYVRYNLALPSFITMVFVTVYFWLTVASTLLSILILILAGVDHGKSSFYLMLLTPSFTIIHHAIIIFIPTYMPQQFEEKRPSNVPIHATKTYIAFLGLLSGLWTLSTLLTFYAVGMNIAHNVSPPTQRTGAAECFFGVCETGVSWAALALCVKERTSGGYKSVPIKEGAAAAVDLRSLLMSPSQASRSPPPSRHEPFGCPYIYPTYRCLAPSAVTIIELYFLPLLNKTYGHARRH